MAKQTLNIGSSANDGTGTSLRAGGDLINDNFNEIYTTFGDGTTLSVAAIAIPHKIGGTNFTGSLLVGHTTTGTLNSAQANTGVGIHALKRITTGDNNTMIGYNSGQSILSGRHNTGLGNESGNSITTGLYNINIGYQSGQNITSGDGNVMIGAAVNADSATGDHQLKIVGHNDSATVTWISGDSSGNLTTVGDVTLANNKKVIFGDAGENITGDGTDLTISSSGKTIIDSVGDIELDAASGVIDFIGNGTVYGNVAVSGTDLILKSRLTDGDISLRGNDGGSEVVALALDISDAGTATFNNHIKLGDSGKAIFGAGSDLEIYHDGSNSFIKDGGTGSLKIQGASTIDLVNGDNTEYLAQFKHNGSVDLYYDSAKKFETTSAGATVTGALTISGDLTVNGTTTTVNSTNTTLDDNLLELNSGATSNANDSGILIERGSTGDNAIIMWDESADKFTLGTTTATADQQ